MAKRSGSGSPTRHLKRKCFTLKCKKKAKDFFDDKPLCRIHSPFRQGFTGTS